MIGDSESEIEMADRAFALNPNSFQAWNCRGHVYRIAGLPEAAIWSFEPAAKRSGGDGCGRFGRMLSRIYASTAWISMTWLI
jgi:hypothetical protein